MGEKRYGVNKDLYAAVERPDGRLEVRVLHSNRDVSYVIRGNRMTPRYFLEHIDTWKRSKISAKRSLAKVVSDYPEHFAANGVDFVFPGKRSAPDVEPAVEEAPNDEPLSIEPRMGCVARVLRELKRLLAHWGFPRKGS